MISVVVERRMNLIKSADKCKMFYGVLLNDPFDEESSKYHF